MSIRTVTVEKTSLKRTSPEKIKAQLQKTVNRILAGGRKEAGWAVAPVVAPNPKAIGDSWKYTYTFKIDKAGGHKPSNDKKFEYIVEKIISPSLNLHHWKLATQSILEEQPPTPITRPKDEAPLSYRPLATPTNNTHDINLDRTGYFDHLFDREAAIEILHSAMTTAVESNFLVRPATVIWGPVASGKTTLINAFTNMVGEEFVYRVDCTSSTQAGILQDLMDAGTPIPYRCLVLEECEKVKNPDDLRFLLGVMDERAEIRVINSRVGYFHARWAPLCIATVNDMDKFKNVMSGALASRFSNQVYTPAISDEAIKNSIMRSISSLNPDKKWVEAAFEYCKKYEGKADIRRMSAIASCGRDRLLDGSYQALLRQTSGRP